MIKESSFRLVNYVDTKSDKWGDRKIVNPVMPLIMDALRQQTDTPLMILRGAHTEGHSPTGDHPKGWGVDFIFPKLNFWTAHREVIYFLDHKDFLNIPLRELCSLGFYPDWNPQGGFHLGFRGYPARWGRIDNPSYMDKHFPDRKDNMVSLEEVTKYITYS